jgi:putative membrane protein
MDKQFVVKAAVASTLMAFGVCVNAIGQTTPTTPDTRADTSKAHVSNVNASKPSANGSKLDRGEVKFIEKAAMDSLAEVELGKLAQDKAHSQAVKDFGARMAKDHTKANDELKPIADAKGVALPSGPDKSHQKNLDKLAKKSGADFDKDFMDHMVKDHKKAVKEFEKESRKAKDADVKNWASNTLPTLEEHLRMAQQTQNEVKGKKKAG